MLERAEQEAGVRAPSPSSASVPARSLTPTGTLAATDALTLQRRAGNRAVGALLRRSKRMLSRLGTPLDQDLPPDADVPVHGEDKGKQRRYSKQQYQAMWEAEQGQKLTATHKTTIDLGCIGITANNLTGFATPDLREAYADFSDAHAAMEKHNAPLRRYDPNQYVLFAIHFWSNQDPDDAKRVAPDHSAFLPDANRRIDMSGYKFLDRPGFVNFDFGFWDEVSQSHWHANHYDAGPSDPMIVLQSTRAHFSKHFEETPGEWRFGYPDFDREAFVVAQAKHYDVSRARKPKLTSPFFLDSSGKPDPIIDAVFRGKKTLQAGSPKAQVEIIQGMLRQMNYDLGDYGPAGDGVDGKYGKKTVAAIKQFKVDENLGNQKSGATDRGVIYRLDELFPF
jgi:microbial transglutaminase/putative peptidoglycan binding protein